MEELLRQILTRLSSIEEKVNMIHNPSLFVQKEELKGALHDAMRRGDKRGVRDAMKELNKRK